MTIIFLKQKILQNSPRLFDVLFRIPDFHVTANVPFFLEDNSKSVIGSSPML